jgi:hypothetical protein
VLGRSFETWLVLINLLLMFVFSAIGKFYSSNPILLDGLSRADVQAVSVLNYLCTFLCGTFFLFFDAFQVLTHLLMLLYSHSIANCDVVVCTRGLCGAGACICYACCCCWRCWHDW